MTKLALEATARAQLDAARAADTGRSSATVYGGHEHRLRQTVIALLAGRELAEHESPGDATLQVLHGRVRLVTPTASWDGRSGDLIIIPPERHSLAADEDAVVLLTVGLDIA